MPLSKSDPILDLKEWMMAAKKQEENDGILIPSPIIDEIAAHPKDFTFRREGWTVIVDWKDHETMYFPVFPGKKSISRKQNSNVEVQKG